MKKLLTALLLFASPAVAQFGGSGNPFGGIRAEQVSGGEFPQGNFEFPAGSTITVNGQFTVSGSTIDLTVIESSVTILESEVNILNISTEANSQAIALLESDVNASTDALRSDLDTFVSTHSADPNAHHAPTVDTNANTECAGDDVYLSGDGNCNTVVSGAGGVSQAEYDVFEADVNASTAAILSSTASLEAQLLDVAADTTTLKGDIESETAALATTYVNITGDTMAGGLTAPDVKASSHTLESPFIVMTSSSDPAFPAFGDDFIMVDNSGQASLAVRNSDQLAISTVSFYGIISGAGFTSVNAGHEAYPDGRWRFIINDVPGLSGHSARYEFGTNVDTGLSVTATSWFIIDASLANTATVLGSLGVEGGVNATGTVDAGGFTEGASNTLSNDISGNAATSTALASDPGDCAAGEFAQSIDSSGNLTCSADGSNLTGTEPAFDAFESTVAATYVDASGDTMTGQLDAPIIKASSFTFASPDLVHVSSSDAFFPSFGDDHWLYDNSGVPSLGLRHSDPLVISSPAFYGAVTGNGNASVNAGHEAYPDGRWRFIINDLQNLSGHSARFEFGSNFDNPLAFGATSWLIIDASLDKTVHALGGLQVSDGDLSVAGDVFVDSVTAAVGYYSDILNNTDVSIGLGCNGFAGVCVENDGFGRSQVFSHTNLGGDIAGPAFFMVRRDNTKASPSATSSGRALGSIMWGGRGTTSDVIGAAIVAMSNETFADGAAGSALEFHVAENGDTAVTAPFFDDLALTISGDKSSEFVGDVKLQSGLLYDSLTIAEFEVLSSTPGYRFQCSDCALPYAVMVSTGDGVDDFRHTETGTGVE